MRGVFVVSVANEPTLVKRLLIKEHIVGAGVFMRFSVISGSGGGGGGAVVWFKGDGIRWLRTWMRTWLRTWL